MLAYSGSIPGPTLQIPEGATVTVHVTNEGDLDATVHWHGLRLENRYDGTHETQAPIPVGETFTYEVTSRTPASTGTTHTSARTTGRSWACTERSSLSPAIPTTRPPADRELLLTLDDVLVEDGKIATFSHIETTYVAMGRFGNVMLVSGEADLSLMACRGEVVRLFLTNTANTRVFNVTLPGARMKLVGADSGHYEREEYVDEVLVAPSERVVVDVLSISRATWRSSTALPNTSTAWLGSRSARRPRSQPPQTRSPRYGRTRTWSPSGNVSCRSSGRPQTRRSRSSPRWTWRARRASRLRMSDAPRGRQRRAWLMPEVWDEAPRDRVPIGDDVRLPNAPRGNERCTGSLPEVRHEARADRAGVRSRT